MRVLIAEDDPVSRKILEAHLTEWGYKVSTASDGNGAWEQLNSDEFPINLAILDWMMPKVDGIEVCRRLRNQKGRSFIYVIMLTAKNTQEDIAAGFDAGIDDYIIKPFDKHELKYRVRAGERIVSLELNLMSRIKALEDSLLDQKQLNSLLPICPDCLTERKDPKYLEQLKKYIARIPIEEVAGSLCPQCKEKKNSRINKSHGQLV